MKRQNDALKRTGPRNTLWANVTLCLVIFLLVGYGIKRSAEAPDILSLLDPGFKPSSRAAAFGDRLVLADFQFELHQVNNRVRASFTLVNDADQPVRDVALGCDFFDRAGEKRGSGRWVIYDTLAARSTGQYVLEEQRYISHLAVPEASNCRIIDVREPSRHLADFRSGSQHQADSN